MRVTFGAHDNFFAQLARLDYLLDLAARRDPPVAVRSIDLALGAQVPVTAAAAPAAARPRGPDRAGRPAAGAGLFLPSIP